MAEHETGQERTESATPKREEEARRQGQVPRSRDLNSAAVTLLSAAAVSVFGYRAVDQLAAMMRGGLSFRLGGTIDPAQMFSTLGAASMSAFMAVLPILAAGFLAAILAPMSLSGWNFSTEALMPQFSRLNPIAGFGRMFAITSWIELGKSMLKFALVAIVAVMLLKKDTHALLALSQQPLAEAMKHAASLCTNAVITLASGMLIIAGIDVPIQLWQHAKQLKMSRQEIRQEHKESEGSPEVKGKIRQMQQESLRRRMMEQVPKADVIITNPTHFAVALRYDESRNRAPMVVAKGADLIAARIREIAAEHKVPLFEAPPLARMLYRSVDLNREIPASLYSAVAQVLTYIYQLRAYNKGLTNMPQRPKIDVEEATP
jgi:flagellar biosynthetic protein FlhB